MGLKFRITIAVAIMAIFSACDDVPSREDFSAGMAREEFVSAFGQPAERQSLIKSSEPIFGPIETFWSGLPLGTIVEIWHYPAEDGTVEIYFIDNSRTAGGVGFAPKGVVY